MQQSVCLDIQSYKCRQFDLFIVYWSYSSWDLFIAHHVWYSSKTTHARYNVTATFIIDWRNLAHLDSQSRLASQSVIATTNMPSVCLLRLRHCVTDWSLAAHASILRRLLLLLLLLLYHFVPNIARVQPFQVRNLPFPSSCISPFTLVASKFVSVGPNVPHSFITTAIDWVINYQVQLPTVSQNSQLTLS